MRSPWSAEPNVRSFGEVARVLLRRMKFQHKGRHTALTQAWRELVGEVIAGKTRVQSFRDGRLVVEVASSALLHEMKGFMMETLLDGLHQAEAGRDVAELKLRLAPRPQGRDAPS